MAFDLRQGEVIVSRADDAVHQDPAIEAFLRVLERDIGAGKHVQALPQKLVREMLANARHAVDIDEAIDGEVAF